MHPADQVPPPEAGSAEKLEEQRDVQIGISMASYAAGLYLRWIVLSTQPALRRTGDPAVRAPRAATLG
jgi:hypothetical protein